MANNHLIQNEVNEQTDRPMKVGDVVALKEIPYRILVLTEGIGIFIQLETTKMNILRVSMDFIKYRVSVGELKRIDWKEDEFPVKTLTEEEQEALNRKVQAMEKALNELYPAWDRIQSKEEKPVLKALMQELECSKSSMHRKLRRYLQSGRNRYSLADGRKGEKNRRNDYKVGDTVRGHGDKTVPNDEQLEAIFQDGYEYFLKGKEHGVSLKAAYRYIIMKYYYTQEYVDGRLETKMLPAEEIPSYRRFWTYCCRQNNGNGISKMKISARERRNNERLLLGNSQSGCMGPGHIVEVDEVEIDMINVSEKDNRQVVGRAVMYLAIDVYSCCIVGCWVDYTNNSFVGITNLLMSLFFDGRKQMKKYGLDAPEGILPVGFIPQELRVDHGSEYTSAELRRVHAELGMNINLVAPATGSLKGLVEQSFHQFQEYLRGAGAGVGIILKRYGSMHYETACVNLDDVRILAYRFVIYYNQHRRDKYPLTKDMIVKEVPPVPASIWQYGCENITSPRYLTESMKKTAFFALLKEDRKFNISRSGITYRGLFYENGEPWLLEKMGRIGTKKEKLPGVRYDPRSVNTIWLMEDGVLHSIPLSEVRDEQKTFRDCTWEEYDSIWAQRKKTSKKLDAHDLEQTVSVQRDMADVIASAKRMQDAGKNRKKNIRAAKKAERGLSATENTLENRLSIAEGSGMESLPAQTEAFLEETAAASEKSGKDKVLSVLPDDDLSDMMEFFGR